MQHIIFVSKKYDPTLAKTILDKYNTIGFFDYKDCVHESVIDFFGVDKTEYYSILADEKRRTTPNTLFLVSIETMYNYFDDVTYQGDAVTENEDMIPLTLEEAIEFVSEYINKPILGQDIYGRRLIKKIEPYKGWVADSILCIEYDTYSQQVTPFIKKFGKEKVIVVDGHNLDNEKIFEIIDSIINTK